MPQTLPPFRYRPLRSSAATRLVQIQPSTATGSGIVVNVLEAFPAGPLSFDALSYTWGTSAPDKPIVANNRRLLVTDNLMKALRRFRHPTDAVSMWIDQLCIDQGNHRERSHQVGMMGTIYRSARMVVVWLGEDYQTLDDGSKFDLKPGLRLARQILEKLRAYPELKFDWSTVLDNSRFPKPGNKHWQALAAILRRPWFGRMWVIQEVVLSSCIEVVCGAATFTWEEVGQVVGYLDCEEYRKWNVKNSELVTDITPYSRINRIKTQIERGMRPDLFDLMLACRDFGATDERDKIYALLQLGEHDIAPDYSMSTRDVFVDFASRTIRMAQQRNCCPGGTENPHVFDCCATGWKERDKYLRIMTILCCAGATNQRQTLPCSEKLPSWVPDWTIDLKVRPLCFWGSKAFAAGSHAYGEVRVGELGQLYIPGKLYDSVKVAGSVNLDLTNLADANDERELIARWHAECSNIVKQTHLPYPVTGKPARVVLKKILEQNDIGQRTQPGRPARPNALAELQRRSSGNVIDDLANPMWVLPDGHYESTMGVAVGRVLFQTSSGYLGLAPHGARDGDILFVMLGCDIPFLLRPEPGSGDFRLLGECFAYGLMEGEAMRDDNIAVRDVTII